jgi:hypothetical protein
MKKIMMIWAVALMVTSAQGVTVKVYSIHTSDEEGGAPYEGYVGCFTSPDIQFATNTGYQWHPFGLQIFGAEITGCLEVEADGTYEFVLDSDDGSMLYIDGDLVINNGGGHAPQTALGEKSLTTGIYLFRVEFYEDFGGASGVDLFLPEGVTYSTCDPTVSFIADPDPVVVGMEVPFEGEFTGGCSGVVAYWEFGDAGRDGPVAASNPLTATHTYGAPGVYTVTLTVEDECAHCASDTAMVVVYDPADGFVTGGGWIEQPLLPGDGQFSLPFFDGNGNYYEMVTIDPTEPWVNWDEANDMADAMRDGYGHLVTITSQDEQDFLHEAFGSSLQNKWYGGFQEPGEPVADANWKWVTGEDWDYTNWAEGEPNDGPGIPGSEQYLIGWSAGAAWNDGGPSYEPGYVVEYEGSQLPIGKATFGFVCKYNKSDNTPIGQTEFVFHSGDLNFHSSSYDWLLVTGSNYARFKGSGTINGSGDYKFMLWAGDDDPDTFRIRIWEEDEFGIETVVYDNGMDQPIGGGSIVIHTKK